MIQKTYFKTKDYCKVKFVLNADNAETAEVLGLNSDWENSVIMKKNKKDGTFSCEVSLPKNSAHQFKYKVNETLWLNEPEADSEQPNEYGGTNSVITL
jgi:1,4-alpha-glucan branching enzyme